MVDGGALLTFDGRRRIIENGAVAIADGKIVALGPRSAVTKDFGADKVIDASGKFVLPGLINVHTHLFQCFMRGFGSDLPVFDWWRKAVGPYVVEMKEEDFYLSALLGSMELIKAGVTCVNDFAYAHPVPRLSDEILRAFDDVGIRGTFSRGIVDTGKELGLPDSIIQDLPTAIEDCERLLETYNKPSAKVWLAPSSIWMASTKAFMRAREVALKHGTRLACHLSESKTIVDHSKRLYGGGDVEVLHKQGFLGPEVLAIHCVWLSDRDIGIFKTRDVKVAHCPVANMYLADGVAPVTKMIAEGVTVGLGTDGPASNDNQDMIALLKHAALLHKVSHLDPTIITAERVLEMATIDGARALGLEREVGSLEVGKRADVIILDTMKPNLIGTHDPLSSTVYAASQESVDTVIVEGRVVMEGRELKTIDEKSALKRINKAAESLVKRSIPL